MADNHTTNITSAENKALLEAAEKFADPQMLRIRAEDFSPLHEEGVPFVALPSGRKLESVKRFIDEYRTNPERKTGTAQLTTVGSFIDHVNRFKDAGSVVFASVANRSAPKLVAVLDYHESGEGKPRFGQHRGSYDFPVSDEWKAWTKPRDPMGQAEFAEFLEERILDILEPNSIGEATTTLATRLGIKFATPQRILELSRGLTIRVGQQVSNNVNLSSGEAQIGFQETHIGGDGGTLSIPGGFAIGIPVFRGGENFAMAVKLRYRVKSGAVVWFFAIQQVDTVWDLAVTGVCEEVQQDTLLPLFYGTPEN